MAFDKNRKSNGWRLVIASVSISSLIGLVNFFSGKQEGSATSEELDQLLDSPMPTLVPPLTGIEPSGSQPLREVGELAPTPTANPQKPVVERLSSGGSSGSGGGNPSTSTSSSR